MLIPQYLVLLLKLTLINTVSLRTVFFIPQNHCYPGTPWSSSEPYSFSNSDYKNICLMTVLFIIMYLPFFLQHNMMKIYLDFFEFLILYARHYKPRLVYFFTPFPKTIYVLWPLALCMACIQERLLIKSGLWWRAHGS